MKTSEELQNENHFTTPIDQQNKPSAVFSDDDREEDRRNDDEELDRPEFEERQDWGDVDPAGGDAPTSPGSAV